MCEVISEAKAHAAVRPAVAAVRLQGVTRIYGKGESAVVALRDLTLSFVVGSFTAVMGASGSGKSTFLHVAAGLDSPTRGAVELGGVDLAGLNQTKLTKLTMIAVHRRRELALPQLIGATPRQVRAMARWEAGPLVILGLGLGVGISMITLMPTSALLTGSSIPNAPAGLVALVLGSAAAAGFLGSQLATRLAMRAKPVDAISLRD